MSNSEKKPAVENPWYVLATLFEDQLDCACYWNAWISQEMSNEEKATIKENSLNQTPGLSLSGFDMKWVDLQKVAERLFKRRLPNATLPHPFQAVDFSNVKFPHNINFKSFIFPSVTNFAGADFSGDVDFTSATFTGSTTFNGAVFAAAATFNCALFSRGANFMGTTFSGNASFLIAVFSEDAIFTNVTFSGNVNFGRTVFSGVSDFYGTKFHKKVFFDNTTFNEFCDFRNVRFIKAYPILSGTQLHSKTTVTAEDEHWPTIQIKKSNDDNKDVLESCTHLRKNMASQGLTDAAHFFFSREMDHKAKLSRWWELPFYKAYSWVEYGYGVGQPLVGIFFLWVVGAVSLIEWGSLHYSTAFGLSGANIFKLLGFQRVYFEDDVIGKLNSYLQFMTAAQTVIGYLLLFLFGLGLRNQFRLK